MNVRNLENFLNLTVQNHHKQWTEKNFDFEFVKDWENIELSNKVVEQIEKTTFMKTKQVEYLNSVLGNHLVNESQENNNSINENQDDITENEQENQIEFQKCVAQSL